MLTAFRSLTQAIKKETYELSALADNVEVIREHVDYLHKNKNGRYFVV